MREQCKESAFSILICCLSIEVGIVSCDKSVKRRLGKILDWKAIMTEENE